MGNTLSAKACMDMQVSGQCYRRSDHGIELQTAEEPRFAALGGYPSVLESPEVGAAALGWLADISKVLWCPENDHPPDLRPCPFQLIAKPSKV